MALFSNDAYLDGSRDPGATAALLQKARFRPDIIVLGSYNKPHQQWAQIYEDPWRQVAARRREHLARAFPKAAIVDLPGKHIGDNCPPPECSCRETCATKLAKVLASDQDFHTRHECIPGPIIRYAEELVSVLHVVRSARGKNMTGSCLGVGRPRPAGKGCP